MVKKVLIRCRGYWLDGHQECDDKFQHYGHWNDKALEEHQDKEELAGSKYGPFWEGFERVEIFGKRERSSVDA